MANVPLYPDVPETGGVPAVLRQAGIIQDEAVLLLADAALLVSAFTNRAPWGLYTPDGALAFSGDTVTALDFRRDSQLSSYQVEQGGFADFDKVITPYDLRLTFTKGGNVAVRAAFLAAAGAIVDTLTLFNAYTPEVTYLSINPVHLSYRRETRSGVGLIAVELWCEQVRVTGTTQFTNTRAPDGATQQNGGVVQSQPSPVSSVAFT